MVSSLFLSEPKMRVKAKSFLGSLCFSGFIVFFNSGLISFSNSAFIAFFISGSIFSLFFFALRGFGSLFSIFELESFDALGLLFLGLNHVSITFNTVLEFSTNSESLLGLKDSLKIFLGLNNVCIAPQHSFRIVHRFRIIDWART